MNENFRVPPQNLEAEQAVLGAMMLSSNATTSALIALTEEDFYREAFRKIFRAIQTIHNKREPIDLITMSNELKRVGEFENIGGITVLSELIDRVPSAANVDYYCQIVLEKSQGRSLIRLCEQTSADCYLEIDPKELKENLIVKLFDEKAKREFLEPVSFAGKIYNESIEQKKIDYIPTGYDELDEKMGGIRVGAVGTITGPFESGKSTFIQNVSVQVAKAQKKKKDGFRVLHMVLEDEAENVMHRQICLMNDIDLDKLKSHDKTIMPADKLADIYGDWAELGIILGDKFNPGKSWTRLNLLIRRAIAQENVKVIFIEAGERMKVKPEHGEEFYQAQDRFVDELDDIAKQCKVAIWVIVGGVKQDQGRHAVKSTMEAGTAGWGRIARQRIYIERHPDHETNKAYENISVLKVTKNSDREKCEKWFEGSRKTYKWRLKA